MNIEKTIIIPLDLNGSRLDQAMANLLPEYSRAQIQNWIREGDVTVEGQTIQKSNYKIKTDQTIVLNAQLQARENWAAQEIPLDIVYQDEDLIVINKQAGLVVHPGAGNPDQTLINALVHFEPELAHLPRAGLIHRLDKDTSGLLLIARNLISYNYLVQELAERKIIRLYQTIIQGTLISGGTINAPIGRHPQQRTKMKVMQTGREAVTHYRIIQRFKKHTHIQVQLETGRTHQIRVHLAHLRRPVVGDPVYGKKTFSMTNLSDELVQGLNDFSRQALHAAELRLVHPTQQTEMTFQAPLPTDMQHLLDLMKTDLETKV